MGHRPDDKSSDPIPSNIRLTYFNYRGRAEVIRYVLAVGGVQYDDIRVDSEGEQMVYPLKVPQGCETNLPFSQFPTLEIDGEVFCQTKAICRYLATLFDLHGETAKDRLYSEMVVECVDDLVNDVIKMRRTKNDKQRNELLEDLVSTIVPRAISSFDCFIKNKPHDGPYLLGERITWADMYFAAFLVNVGGYMKRFVAEGFGIENYPRIANLISAVENHPAIADWIRRRPVTAR
ncbi:hypothetical protein CAPTEDRAFT_221395 [Capitella teleta]|uniref:Glutathione S-transferase n=1 Tax=Capitella teleta TaxID=283909 RepID=R7UV25_CAPTE|nr:hypothetical protein CAPTEDRAFT_221395 [Capitella teleta]|eukprot:ELU09993.1 hypothetical protein CAPTEDRAFT_221395 [Capitella teleta]